MKNIITLFLIDGIGAVVSSILLGIVLVKLECYFGIPVKTLYILAAFPVLFALYDFVVYFKVEKHLALYLKGIATANIAYCFLSMAAAYHHSMSIKLLGWIYIIIEIIIVMSLAIFQVKTARSYKSRT